MEQKMAVDEKAEQNRTMLEHTNLFADDETRQPLDECKIQVQWGTKNETSHKTSNDIIAEDGR